MVGPIEGLRVVDCSRGTAGPRATGMLADYGADVVWVEPPGGDPLPAVRARAVSVLDRGKRSVELDLARRVAREQLLELADRRRGVRRELAPGRRRAARPRLRRAARPQPRAGLRARSPASARTSDLDLPRLRGDRAGRRSAACPTRSAHRDGPVVPRLPVRQHRRRVARGHRRARRARRAREDGCGRHVPTSLLDGALAYNSMLWGESDASIASQEPPLSLQVDGEDAPRSRARSNAATASTSGCTPVRSARSGER